MQLVVEIDGLVQRFGRLVPDAAGLFERVAEIRVQATAPHRRLDVTLARFGANDTAALRADITALGLDWAVHALDAEVIALAGAADLAGADAATGVVLLAGRHREAREAIAAGLPAYLISDRRSAEHWQVELKEAPRVIAEAVRLPVPRQLPNSERRGTLIAVPEESTEASRVRGGEALNLDICADWLTIGDTQLIYVEDERAADTLLARPGAQRVAKGVDLASAGVAKGENTKSDTIFTSGDYSLVFSIQSGDMRWEHARRRRFGVKRPPRMVLATKLPSLPQIAAALGTELVNPALDLGLVDENGAPLRCLGLPYEAASADGLLVLLVDRGVESQAIASFADLLRERLEGDAILACWSDSMPSQVLWQSERNRLRAIIRVRSARVPAIEQTTEESQPQVPVVTISAPSTCMDWNLFDLDDRIL